MGLYDVNGKTPVTAWIPSLDTAGNGTTTLTDLVSSNTGTLTNFALTGSTSNWITDTDAGGVRALDHDGSNDYVTCGTSIGNFSGVTPFAFALWIKITASGTDKGIFSRDNGSQTLGYHLRLLSSGAIRWIVYSGGSAYRGIDSSVLSANTWYSVVCVWTGSGVSMRINTTAASSTLSAGTVGTLTQTRAFEIGRLNTTYATMRFDDFRVFDQSLDSSDAAYLYQSGAGRGRVASPGDFESGMFGGMSGTMTGGMAS